MLTADRTPDIGSGRALHTLCPTQIDLPVIGVLAALPPPVNGLHLATQLVVHFLQSKSPVLLHDWSPGPGYSGLWWRVMKGFRAFASVWKLCVWRFQNCRTLYTVANGNGGLFYNVLTIAVARILGYRCILHHHTYIYLARPDLRIRFICRLMGRSDLHVVLAEEMAARFREVYGDRTPFFVLPNNYILKTMQRSGNTPVRNSGASFRLGHLGNLTFAKGLQHVIRTFEQLLSQNHDVTLTLAGPLMGSGEEQLVKDLLSQHPSRVWWLGPVSGRGKEQFFESIDVLLFPSEMNEAQPLVILEAMLFGKPTLAWGRGAIGSMISTTTGRVFPIETDFAPAAAEVVRDWVRHPEHYEQIEHAVLQHGATLLTVADQQLISFHQELTGASDPLTPDGPGD